MSADEQPKGPLTREEYERRHKALQDKYNTFSRRTYSALAVIVIGLLVTAGTNAYLLNENTERTQDINDSLVLSCEENGNPLRAAVRQFAVTLIAKTQNDINQSQSFERSGTYNEIFPSYPPNKLHALLVKNREEERTEIKELRRAKENAAPTSCEDRFRHP